MQTNRIIAIDSEQLEKPKFLEEEITEKIRKVLRYARQSGPEEREILANQLRKEAAKHQSRDAYITLIKIAERIESMESNPELEDVKEVGPKEKVK